MNEQVRAVHLAPRVVLWLCFFLMTGASLLVFDIKLAGGFWFAGRLISDFNRAYRPIAFILFGSAVLGALISSWLDRALERQKPLFRIITERFAELWSKTALCTSWIETPGTTRRLKLLAWRARK